MPLDDLETLNPRDAFIREIEGRIIKGKLAVGEKLPTERELEAQTGISKSVIHFALKDLEHKGFINIVPRQGAYVTDYARKGSLETLNEILRYNGGKLSFKMSVEVVELRNAIEGGALIRLAANHTDEDIRQLREMLNELRNEDAKSLNTAQLAELTSRFHYKVCELSGNDMFTLLMNSFSTMSKVIWEYCAAFWGLEGFIEQDEKLIDLIERGEGQRAKEYIEEIFAQYLESYLSEKKDI